MCGSINTTAAGAKGQSTNTNMSVKTLSKDSNEGIFTVNLFHRIF